MIKNKFRASEYVLNAELYEQLPPDIGIEVAFAGRSNAGKSSLINVLTDQKSLARTSKLPGRTRHLVCFEVAPERRLIDLPGYGYASVSLKMKDKWGKTLDKYFQTRESLKGLVLIMDIRHPLKPDDYQMIQWCEATELPLHIVLNKSDKLSRGAASQQLMSVKKELSDTASIQLFSALKKQGLEQLLEKLNVWFEFDE